jgi:hypothetical protein
VVDITFLPESVQRSAVRVNSGLEVMWPFDEAEAAINALASAGKVILGLDLRSDGPVLQSERRDGLATEVPWSSFEPLDAATAVADGRGAALDELRRPGCGDLAAEGYMWVLITWDGA